METFSFATLDAKCQIFRPIAASAAEAEIDRKSLAAVVSNTAASEKSGGPLELAVLCANNMMIDESAC